MWYAFEDTQVYVHSAGGALARTQETVRETEETPGKGKTRKTNYLPFFCSDLRSTLNVHCSNAWKVNWHFKHMYWKKNFGSHFFKLFFPRFFSLSGTQTAQVLFFSTWDQRRGFFPAKSLPLLSPMKEAEMVAHQWPNKMHLLNCSS